MRFIDQRSTSASHFMEGLIYVSKIDFLVMATSWLEAGGNARTPFVLLSVSCSSVLLITQLSLPFALFVCSSDSLSISIRTYLFLCLSLFRFPHRYVLWLFIQNICRTSASMDVNTASDTLYAHTYLYVYLSLHFPLEFPYTLPGNPKKKQKSWRNS